MGGKQEKLNIKKITLEYACSRCNAEEDVPVWYI